MMSRFRRSLVLLGCVLAAAACTTDTPFYSLQVDAPDTVSLLPGESRPVEITLTRVSEEQSGEIRLGLQNAPEGVTLQPEIVLPAGEESVTATPTLSVPAALIEPGPRLTLLYAEDPAKDFAAGASFYIVILPQPVAQPDFSISVEPRQVDIFAGQSTQVQVTVTRAAGFTGDVAITLQSPTGRITAQPLTITADNPSRVFFINTDRSTTRIPAVTTVIATSADNRTATTGLTINLR